MIKTCVLAVSCVLLYAQYGHAYGVKPVIIDGSFESASIGRNLDYIVDSGKNLSFNNVSSDAKVRKLKWIHSHEDNLGFGFSTSAYWVRFAIRNISKKDIAVYLKQDYPLINHISLYAPDEKGGYHEIKTGNAYPFSQRAVQHRCFIFPLKIKAGNEARCYMRYESKSSMNIQLAVMSPAAFHTSIEYEIIFFWMFYGILFVMLVYNLIMFFATLDPSYFYYVIYIASFGLFTMSLNGMAYRYLWPNNIWIGIFATPICMAIIIISLHMFARTYIEVRSFSRFWDNILLAWIALAVATLAMTFITGNYRLSITVTTALSGSAAASASMFVINFVFVKKSRPAVFFSISMLMFLIGVIMAVLRLFGLIPANIVTVNGIMVGAVLQIIMLSFGLADRINIMKKELTLLNVELENKVEERTAELLAANEELEAMNWKLKETRDSLWGEMQLAKKIQTVLLPEKPSISGYEICAYMNPAENVGGDYYDIINEGGKDWIVIGDVSGHGVPAGLIMMMIQTSISTIIADSPGLPPSEVLIRANNTIYKNIQKLGENKYMTITVLAAHSKGEFVFSGLHQDIMVYRKRTGDVDCIDTNGLWIGVVEDLNGKVGDSSFAMEKGDTALLYTDGIFEAWEKSDYRDRNDPFGQMFGTERLKDTFRKSAEKPIDEIKADILSALEHYECMDDITMVIIRRQ
ncbi:MAG: SpoIIE family protein phosphatase [Spirochaetes bacterium]|nr:SpoIIE family protein phosphatase [Spirochaetota bacterium]